VNSVRAEFAHVKAGSFCLLLFLGAACSFDASKLRVSQAPQHGDGSSQAAADLSTYDHVNSNDGTILPDAPIGIDGRDGDAVLSEIDLPRGTGGVGGSVAREAGGPDERVDGALPGAGGVVGRGGAGGLADAGTGGSGLGGSADVEGGAGGLTGTGGAPGTGGAQTGGAPSTGGIADAGAGMTGGSTGLGGTPAFGGFFTGGRLATGGTATNGGTTTTATGGSGGNPLGSTGGTTHVGPWKIMLLGDGMSALSCYPQLLSQDFKSHGDTNFQFTGTNQVNQNCNGAPAVSTAVHEGYRVTSLVTNNTSGQGNLGQLQSWSALKPDIAIMDLGSDDASDGKSNATILSAFAVVINQFRGQNPNVIFFVSKVTPVNSSSNSNWASAVVNLNSQITNAWAASNTTATSPVYIIDQWTGFSATTDTSDGIIPDMSGSQKMADNAYAAVSVHNYF